MAVHDIDLTLWYFGSRISPNSISVYGVVATQPSLKQYKDHQKAVGVVEFWDDRIAHYFAHDAAWRRGGDRDSWYRWNTHSEFDPSEESHELLTRRRSQRGSAT